MGKTVIQSYTHVQDAAATEWTINHGLGGASSGLPVVICVDASNAPLTYSNLKIVDKNTITIYFSTSKSGKCQILV